VNDVTRKLLARAARWIAIATVVALIGWALVRLDWVRVRAALAHADFRLVALAALLNLAHMACKSERWHLMLRRFAQVPRLRLYHYLVVSFAMSNVLPARAGEAVRPLVLLRRHQVPVSASLGIIAVEKVFELIGLLAIAAPLPFLLPLPRWALWAIGGVAVVGLSSCAVAIVVARHSPSARWPWLARMGQGLEVVRRPSDFAAATFWSIAGHVVDLLELWLVMHAVGIEASLGTAGFVLFTLNCAVAVPSTPGHLGMLEGGAVAGFHALGVPAEPALACALLYHVMQGVPVLLFGLTGIELLRETKVTKAVEVAPEKAA
jgi:uncharacterized membrane protein YbhN (UPF0104 family)